MTNDTLVRNVAFGVTDQDINLDRVNNSLRMAQLSEFVKGLKEGAYTTVGERGTALEDNTTNGIARALSSTRNFSFG